MKHLRGLMVFLCYLGFSGSCLLAQVPVVRTGDTIPCFQLRNTSDQYYQLDQDTAVKGYVLVFTSNDCSFSKQYLNRIKKIHNRYFQQGYPVLAINIGDSILRPEDSFSKMKELVERRKLPFQYLLDSQQVVAEYFGIRTIPVVFVLKKQVSDSDQHNCRQVDFVIAYRGAIDDSPSNENLVERDFLSNAMDLILQGKEPLMTETSPIGCKIGDKRN